MVPTFRIELYKSPFRVERDLIRYEPSNHFGPDHTVRKPLIILFGMHQKLDRWWPRKGVLSDGWTHQITNKMFTSDDKNMFGSDGTVDGGSIVLVCNVTGKTVQKTTPISLSPSPNAPCPPILLRPAIALRPPISLCLPSTYCLRAIGTNC